MINKKGAAINELLIVLVLCLTVSVILLSLILKRVNEQRFRTLKTNLDLFISSSSLYNIDNGTGVVSLKELVDTKVINPVKDPFNQSKNCDLYESRVLKNGSKIVGVLKCNEYLITKDISNRNIIYKTDEWNDKNSNNSNVKIGYNYIKNGKLIFDDYYEDYMFLYLFNKVNNTSYSDISSIPQNYNIISQIFYRKLTKIKEI